MNFAKNASVHKAYTALAVKVLLNFNGLLTCVYKPTAPGL